MASPTEMMPEVLPPTTIAPQESAARRIWMASCSGMPSAMVQIFLMPASRASNTASLVNLGGTNSMATSAGSFMPRRTEWYTGMPSTSCPSLPGVTPKTTCVPMSFMCFAQKAPSLPVTPCTTTRESLWMKMLITPSRQRYPQPAARLLQCWSGVPVRRRAGWQRLPLHWCRGCR